MAEAQQPTKSRAVPPRLPIAAVTSDGTKWTWDDLFGEFASSIRSFAWCRGASSPDDIVQDVFTTLIERYPRFEGDRSGLRSLIFTLAYRRVVDDYRGRARRYEPLSEHEPLEDQPSVEETLAGREAVAEAVDALDILGDRERQVIEMRVLDDLPPHAVATRLGITNGNVRVIQARALMRMRNYLRAREATPLPSFGMIVAFVRFLRGRGADDDLDRWTRALRSGTSSGLNQVTPAMDRVGAAAAATGGLFAASVIKIGVVVSLIGATAAGTLALVGAEREDPPALVEAVEAPIGGEIVDKAPILLSEQSPSTDDPPFQPPSKAPDIVEGVPGLRVTAQEEPAAPREVSVVEEVVEPVVDEVVTPVVNATTETAATATARLVETTDTVVEKVVEPVVEVIVAPLVTETTETVDDVVDVIEPLTKSLGGLDGG